MWKGQKFTVEHEVMRKKTCHENEFYLIWRRAVILNRLPHGFGNSHTIHKKYINDCAYGLQLSVLNGPWLLNFKRNTHHVLNEFYLRRTMIPKFGFWFQIQIVVRKAPAWPVRFP